MVKRHLVFLTCFCLYLPLALPASKGLSYPLEQDSKEADRPIPPRSNSVIDPRALDSYVWPARAPHRSNPSLVRPRRPTMPAPCDGCKDTCGGGKAACGANCTCGPSCACGDGKGSGGKPCCAGGKK